MGAPVGELTCCIGKDGPRVSRHVVLNLVLAAIPVVLAYVMAWCTSRKGPARRVLLPLGLVIAILWLTFLPNTCYLLTEWRHLLLDRKYAALLDQHNDSNQVMMQAARLALCYLAYSGFGVLTFALSIRPVERMLAKAGWARLILAVPFFVVVSVGVYLGLVLRWNSVDAIRHAPALWASVQDVAQHMALRNAVLIFAAILWCLYEAVDLWIDGVLERLRRWGLAPKTSRAS